MIKSERKRIGARITALRQEKGLTHEQLAEMTGLFVGELIRLEKGRNNIRLTELISLAQALGVSIDFLKWDKN